jgi:hypothetical protein
MEDQGALDLFENTLMPIPTWAPPDADGGSCGEADAAWTAGSSFPAAPIAGAVPTGNGPWPTQKKKRRIPTEARLVQNAEAQKRYR